MTAAVSQALSPPSERRSATNNFLEQMTALLHGSPTYRNSRSPASTPRRQLSDASPAGKNELAADYLRRLRSSGTISRAKTALALDAAEPETTTIGVHRDIESEMGRLPTQVLGALVRQTLEGLGYLHTTYSRFRNDLTPRRIFVTSKWCIAIEDGAAAEHALSTALTATQRENAMYTLLHMSRERLLALPPTAQEDFWSLGIIVATWATGNHPFVSKEAITDANPSVWKLSGAYINADEWEKKTLAALESNLADADVNVKEFVFAAIRRDATLQELLKLPLVAMTKMESIDIIRRYFEHRPEPR